MRRPASPLASVRSSVQGVGWPPVSHGLAADLVALAWQFEDSQWLAAGALQALQLRQLGQLIPYLRDHSAQFRGRLENAGLAADDVLSPGGLARLPVLTRRMLQDAGDLYCDAVPPGHAPVREMHTSGSTGEPVVVRRTEVNVLDWAVIGLRHHLWQGRDPRGRFCAVRANVAEISRYADWRGAIALLFETGPSLSIPITTDIDRQIELIADFAPESLLTYPTALAAMAQSCADRGIALPSLRHIQLIGETLSPEVRELAGRVFGATVSDCYSSEEVGYIALECPEAPHYHVMAETLLVEVLAADGAPCREGEVGRVIVTDLRNFCTPLIRYDIGDYAEVGPTCPCGRGLPTLRRILGRERNLILMPDGTRHWPLSGRDQFREIAPIRQYQLIQDGRESIEARLVADRPLTAPEEAELRTHIQASLGFPFALRFVYFDARLPAGPNGKFEEFVCRVT